MITKWTQHLKTDKEKEDFKRQIRASKDVLDRLTDMIKEEEDRLDRSEIDIRVFDQPNWAERQAFKNGYRACLSVVNKITNTEDQRERDQPVQ